MRPIRFFGRIFLETEWWCQTSKVERSTAVSRLNTGVATRQLRVAATTRLARHKDRLLRLLLQLLACLHRHQRRRCDACVRVGRTTVYTAAAWESSHPHNAVCERLVGRPLDRLIMVKSFGVSGSGYRHIGPEHRRRYRRRSGVVAGKRTDNTTAVDASAGDDDAITSCLRVSSNDRSRVVTSS